MKIESGIEIPSIGAARVTYKSTAKAMNIGDSVFFEDHRKALSLLQIGLTALGAGSLKLRKVEGGYRVWRI
jgi:hypothetical protein